MAGVQVGTGYIDIKPDMTGFGRDAESSAPKLMLLGFTPRYCPFGDGDSIRLIRGSTAPPNWVPFIRPTTNSVCR